MHKWDALIQHSALLVRWVTFLTRFKVLVILVHPLIQTVCCVLIQLVCSVQQVLVGMVQFANHVLIESKVAKYVMIQGVSFAKDSIFMTEVNAPFVLLLAYLVLQTQYV